MRIGILLLISAAALLAQPLPQGTAIKGIDIGDPSKMLTGITVPEIHIHFLMHGSCKGEPDHVYGHSDKVYYACINEQDICTVSKAHNGATVPRALITQYEQIHAIQEAERQKYEEERPKREAEAAAARQRSEAITNEVRTARAQGRQPNLAQFNLPSPAPATRTAATRTTVAEPAGTVAVATVKRATTTLLADEKLDGITTGAALNDVLQKLGNPYLRIAGDSDHLTYRLESGGTAELYFERGVLARMETRPLKR